MQNRKDSATSMLYLANGRQLITNVNGISSEDGSGYAIVQGREFKVAPLPDEWRAKMQTSTCKSVHGILLKIPPIPHSLHQHKLQKGGVQNNFLPMCPCSV